MARLLSGGRILLPPSEIKPCIEHYRLLTMTDGREKLLKIIKEDYFGISRDRIRRALQATEQVTADNPLC